MRQLCTDIEADPNFVQRDTDPLRWLSTCHAGGTFATSAPSTYSAHVARRADPARLPPRAKRDLVLTDEIRRVFEANFRVYGVRKVWRQLGREGIDVARCAVARLMRQMALQGAVRAAKSARPSAIQPLPARWIG